MNTNEAAALGGIIGASIMIVSLIGLAVFVLTVIARWKIFTKAGEAGWKSIIPIYSEAATEARANELAQQVMQQI